MKFFGEDTRDDLRSGAQLLRDHGYPRYAEIVEGLVAERDEYREALESIAHNLEGYPDGSCDACSYNLANIRPTAQEALDKFKRSPERHIP